VDASSEGRTNPPTDTSDVVFIFSSFCFVPVFSGICVSSTVRLDNDSVTEDFNLEASSFLVLYNRLYWYYTTGSFMV
jgi:hypothetical protein